MSLRSALKRLTAARYLRDSKSGSLSSFALGDNGALLRGAVESRLRKEVTKGQLVSGVMVSAPFWDQQLITERVQSALNGRVQEGMKDDAIFNVNIESNETPAAAVENFSFGVREMEGWNDIEGDNNRNLFPI